MIAFLPITINDAPASLLVGLNETELVNALQAGDLKAFSELYKNYAPALLGIITRIVKSTECAEDVLQETFIKISKSISNYDRSKGRLFTWMAKLAKNTAIDLLRNRNHINSTKNEDLGGISEKIEIKYSASYNPEVIGVRQLTQGLSNSQKEILDLIYFQGYSHSEAADALNIPIGTIKTRIRNSILTLRKLFN